MKETELGQIVVERLRGYGFETWHEVDLGWGNRTIDIVGKIGDNYAIFELKTSLSDELLEQIKRVKYLTPFCFAVIPYSHSRRISDVKRLFCETHHIYIWEINGNYPSKERIHRVQSHFGESLMTAFINTIHPIHHFPIATTRNIEECLVDEQKNIPPGSTPGKVITPFKRSCSLVKKVIEEDSTLISVKDVWNKIKDEVHWKSLDSMRSAFGTFCYVNSDLDKAYKILLKRKENNNEKR